MPLDLALFWVHDDSFWGGFRALFAKKCHFVRGGPLIYTDFSIEIHRGRGQLPNMYIVTIIVSLSCRLGPRQLALPVSPGCSFFCLQLEASCLKLSFLLTVVWGSSFAYSLSLCACNFELVCLMLSLFAYSSNRFADISGNPFSFAQFTSPHTALRPGQTVW